MVKYERNFRLFYSFLNRIKCENTIEECFIKWVTKQRRKLKIFKKYEDILKPYSLMFYHCWQRVKIQLFQEKKKKNNKLISLLCALKEKNALKIENVELTSEDSWALNTWKTVLPKYSLKMEIKKLCRFIAVTVPNFVTRLRQL